MQSILDNARELFLDRGYVSTAVEDITSAAGVSRATFWTYFAAKQDVLRALGENVEEEGLRVARQFADLPESASVEDVAGWVVAYLDFLDAHGAFINATYQAAYTDPELRQWGLASQVLGAETLGKGLLKLRGGVATEGIDTTIQGLGILNMLERFWYQWRVGGLEVDDDAAALSLAQLIWGTGQSQRSSSHLDVPDVGGHDRGRSSYKTSYTVAVADTITFRPDEDTSKALDVLTRDGTAVSAAVRSALIDAARRKADAAIRAEAEGLAEDESDRAEAMQVLRDMETLRAW